MSVILEDRPIEQVREEVIDKLIYNYSHGVISAEAFERRLDKAMATNEHAQIVALTADLSMKADEQYSAKKSASFNINYAEPSIEQDLNIKTILGNNERSGRWSVPKQITLLNVFGSTTLDFTDAVFHHQEVIINIDCILGSEKILIPEGVNVVCEAFCILGNIENKAPSIAPKQAPTIKIKGKLWLGSIDVEIKRTIKEKFVSFANELKSLFDDGSYGKYK